MRFETRDVQNRIKKMKIRKRMIIFFYKSLLFHKSLLFFMHHFPLLYKHSNFKNEIRNSRCSKSDKKNENRKFENDYVLLNIFVTMSHKKKFTF